MTEFYTVKRIDNSRLVRLGASDRFRECLRRVALGGLLAGVGLVYAWQHLQCLQLSYRLEELKTARAQAAEINQQLRLHAAELRSPGRIDGIARQLGLTMPAPGQVARIEGPSEGVVAQARAGQSGATQ